MIYIKFKKSIFFLFDKKIIENAFIAFINHNFFI